MHPKCAGMEKIRANDHNIRYIALKVSNLGEVISGFCGFGVLVMFFLVFKILLGTLPVTYI